jgi:SAM-dependent methyltransferase
MSHGPAILTPAYYERLEMLERRHWWCRSVRRVGLDLLGRLVPGAGLLLDAGCGTGGFLAGLAGRSSSVRGVGADVSLDALARARGRGVVILIAASVLDVPAASGTFDAVVSNDVLQHLPPGEDGRALAEAFRVLKPGGFLCVRTNLGTSVAPDPSLHRRYGRSSASRLVTGAGFAIVAHVVLHPLARLWSDLRASRGREHGDRGRGLTLSLPPAPLNAAMDVYSRLEDAVVRRLPFTLGRGDAQILIARKPGGYTAPASHE